MKICPHGGHTQGSLVQKRECNPAMVMADLPLHSFFFFFFNEEQYDYTALKTINTKGSPFSFFALPAKYSIPTIVYAS